MNELNSKQVSNLLLKNTLYFNKEMSNYMKEKFKDKKTIKKRDKK